MCRHSQGSAAQPQNAKPPSPLHRRQLHVHRRIQPQDSRDKCACARGRPTSQTFAKLCTVLCMCRGIQEISATAHCISPTRYRRRWCCHLHEFESLTTAQRSILETCRRAAHTMMLAADMNPDRRPGSCIIGIERETHGNVHHVTAIQAERVHRQPS